MALQAEELFHRFHTNEPSDTYSHSSLQHPHITIDILAAQVTEIGHTISELKTRLHRLEGTSYPPSTAISHSDTSRTRESKRTRTSALTDYTDPTTSAPYTRSRKSCHDTKKWPTCARSRLYSPRYRSTPQWKSPPYTHPTEDYTATNISPDDILLWSEKILTTHEKPSARYYFRIFQVPGTMVGHNMFFTDYTTDWRRFRSKKLRDMDGVLPHHMSTAQHATLHRSDFILNFNELIYIKSTCSC